MGFSIKADDDVGDGFMERVMKMQQQIYTAPMKLLEPTEETHYVRNGLIVLGVGFLGYKGYQFYRGRK